MDSQCSSTNCKWCECLMSDIHIPPHPTRLTYIPKEEKECQYHQGFIKWQTEIMKMNINLHLQFFTIQSKHLTLRFSPSKRSISSCALSSSKGMQERCIAAQPANANTIMKARTPPSTEINVSLNICSKYFRKHPQHKCQHQISKRTNIFQIFQNIKFLKRPTFTQ